MTALLLTERSKQFLNDEEMTKFQEAFKNARRTGDIGRFEMLLMLVGPCGLGAEISQD